MTCKDLKFMRLTIKPKPIHLAKMIRDNGDVSPICAEKPRAINLSKSSWTNRKNAVTCRKCLEKISN